MLTRSGTGRRARTQLQGIECCRYLKSKETLRVKQPKLAVAFRFLPVVHVPRQGRRESKAAGQCPSPLRWRQPDCACRGERSETNIRYNFTTGATHKKSCWITPDWRVFRHNFFFILPQSALEGDGVSGGSMLTKEKRDFTPIDEVQAVRGRVPNVGSSSPAHAQRAGVERLRTKL